MKLLFILVAAFGLSIADVLAQNGCKCGGNTYTSPTIASAILAGNQKNPNPTTSSGTYPHLFGNREMVKFPNCNTSLIEFPLIQGGFWSDGKPPGPDRVAYQRGGKFCGCMTHTGAVGNNFTACTYT